MRLQVNTPENFVEMIDIVTELYLQNVNGSNNNLFPQHFSCNSKSKTEVFSDIPLSLWLTDTDLLIFINVRKIPSKLPYTGMFPFIPFHFKILIKHGITLTLHKINWKFPYISCFLKIFIIYVSQNIYVQDFSIS